MNRMNQVETESVKIALTYEQAAEAVGVGVTTLKTWTRDGSLPVSWVSDRCPRILVDDLKKFVTERRTTHSERNVGVDDQRDQA